MLPHPIALQGGHIHLKFPQQCSSFCFPPGYQTSGRSVVTTCPKLTGGNHLRVDTILTLAHGRGTGARTEAIRTSFPSSCLLILSFISGCYWFIGGLYILERLILCVLTCKYFCQLCHLSLSVAWGVSATHNACITESKSSMFYLRTSRFGGTPQGLSRGEYQALLSSFLRAVFCSLSWYVFEIWP